MIDFPEFGPSISCCACQLPGHFASDCPFSRTRLSSTRSTPVHGICGFFLRGECRHSTGVRIDKGKGTDKGEALGNTCPFAHVPMHDVVIELIEHYIIVDERTFLYALKSALKSSDDDVVVQLISTTGAAAKGCGKRPAPKGIDGVVDVAHVRGMRESLFKTNVVACAASWKAGDFHRALRVAARLGCVDEVVINLINQNIVVDEVAWLCALKSALTNSDDDVVVQLISTVPAKGRGKMLTTRIDGVVDVAHVRGMREKLFKTVVEADASSWKADVRHRAFRVAARLGCVVGIVINLIKQNHVVDEEAWLCALKAALTSSNDDEVIQLISTTGPAAKGKGKGKGKREHMFKTTVKTDAASWKADVRHRALRVAARLGYAELVWVLYDMCLNVDGQTETKILEAFRIAVDAKQWSIASNIMQYKGWFDLLDRTKSGHHSNDIRLHRVVVNLIEQSIAVDEETWLFALNSALRGSDDDLLVQLTSTARPVAKGKGKGEIQIGGRTALQAFKIVVDAKQWGVAASMIQDKRWYDLLCSVKTEQVSNMTFEEYLIRAAVKANEWLFLNKLVGECGAARVLVSCLMDRTSRLNHVALSHGSRNVKWQYERGSGWADFDAGATSSLEQAYASDNPQDGNLVSIQVGHVTYTIDTQLMEQRNDRTGRKRNVQRIEHQPKEYVSPLSCSQVEEVLRKRCHTSSVEFPSSKCDRWKHSSVSSVKLIKSDLLRRTYENAARGLTDKHTRFSIDVASHALPEELCLHHLDSSLNEGFYFHGTDRESACRIEQFGFDERFSKGIYGDGLYFTPDACKALQYAKPPVDGIGILIIARVLLGDVCYVTSTRRSRHAPEREHNEPGMLYDSVVARPGDMQGAPKDTQHHTEVVIFNGAQCCPVYIVEVRMP